MKQHSAAEEEMNERAALYALGALSQHEARAFEEHLAEGCDACATIHRDFEETVATLGFAAPEATPPPRVREQLLACLAEETREQPAAATPLSQTPTQLLTLRADEGEWQKVTDGIFSKQLFVDHQAGTVTSLFKMLPGTLIPMHRHRGVEQCYVIEGDFHAAGQALGPGDYHCAMADSIHKPVYTVDGALVLIVATAGYEVLEQHP